MSVPNKPAFRTESFYIEELATTLRAQCYYDAHEVSVKIEFTIDGKPMQDSTKAYKACEKLINEILDSYKKWKEFESGVKVLADLIELIRAKSFFSSKLRQ